jgi:hypothetical protein
LIVEGKLLDNFPRFLGVSITQPASGGLINGTFGVKINMVVEDLD